MENHPIRDARLRYSLTQKQVCLGLCPVATYGRIEISKNFPEFILTEALAGRLGMDASEFGLILSDRDFQLFEARRSILADIQNEYCREAEGKLISYERKMPKHHLHLQFVLCQKARLKRISAENSIAHDDVTHPRPVSAERTPDETGQPLNEFDEIFPSSLRENNDTMGLLHEEEDLLLKAWSLTKNTFEVNENELYTPTEIYILLDLIHRDSSRWNMDHIQNQLDILLLKVEKFFSGSQLEELKNACMWEILCQGKKTWNLRKLLGKTEDAIRILSPWHSFRHAIRLHIFKAQVLSLFLERPGDTAVEREQFIRECRMVYFSFDSLGQEWRRERIAAYCMEKTGVDIRI